MSNACTYHGGINGLSSMQNVVSSLQKKTEIIYHQHSFKSINLLDGACDSNIGSAAFLFIRLEISNSTFPPRK